MNGKFSPPLLKFEKTYSFCKPGRICKFTSTDDYNNIVSISRTKTSSDTVILYHKSPGSLKSSIDGNLDEIFTEFGYYDKSWVTNNWLKLESPGKNGQTGGAHTYTAGAAQMLTDINTIINGGKIDKYYIDEDGNCIGVTTGGLEVPVDRIGKGVKKTKNKSDSGFVDTDNGNNYYDGSKDDDDDDEKSTKKYIIIGLAVVALIVTFIILKKKKII